MKKASQANPNQRLAYARLQRAWSQQEVANLVDTTRANISRWERGITNPTPYFRQRLCALFQKDAGELGFLLALEIDHTERIEAIGPSSLSATVSATWHPPYWSLPFQRNPFFTGREKTLTTIHHIFHASTREALAQTCVISGMGGVGKTQVALEYAFRYRHDYQAVLWARGETYEMLTEDATTLARVLHLSEDEQQKPESAVYVVRSWLRDHSNWLLLLDDTTDPRVIQEVRTLAHHGHILLTTVSQASGLSGQHIHLSPMETDEATLFLLRRARVISPDAGLADASERQRNLARRISTLLGGLPLALDQAGSYIEETACDLAEYAHLYTKSRATFLKRRGVITAGHSRSVITTMQQALDAIEQADSGVIDLLKLCAYLQPEAIPEEIITEGANILDAPLRAFATNVLAFNDALAQLRHYSLIERDPLTRTLRLHRLVQEVIRENIAESEKSRWMEYTIKALRYVFSERAASTARSGQRFFQQAQICAEIIKQENMAFPEATQLLQSIDRYLLAQAREQHATDTKSSGTL